MPGMKVEFELWQLIMLSSMILGAFYGMSKMLMAQSAKSIEDSFKALREHMVKQDESDRRLERELLQLQAQLPRDYVRREDYTQAIATIMTKIDGVVLRVENLFHQALKGSQQ